MHVIGTAGHVDHGKSTLVRILTGINPDRLKEEQEREMTIDLGFAWLDLPNGESVSIVDVPGHEDFIRNMLAGIGAVDAAMLIVAADEGVMPQTLEHLSILDLLEVKSGLVALTKTDLVEDPEWLELVEQDITEVLAKTSLSEARIIPVSARTGQGIPELINELTHLLDSTPARPDLGRPRLPIDRVFTVAGFGTVVTGTLIDGRLGLADEVEVLPGGLKARIRGLQSHKHKIELGVPGSRLAVNLSGIGTDQLRRGDVLTRPGCIAATPMVDVRIKILPDNPTALRHNMAVEFFSGSSRIGTHTRVLGVQEIAPGECGWVQLCFDESAVLAKGDRFILREFSPSRTIGGGIVVEPHPRKRHPRFRAPILERLKTLADGSPEEVLLEVLRNNEPIEAVSLMELSNLDRPLAEQALDRIRTKDTIMVLGGDNEKMETSSILSARRHLITRDGWQRLIERVIHLLKEYHIQYPLRRGMPREEMKSRLRFDARSFADVMELAAESGHIVAEESLLRFPEHAVQLTPAQQRQMEDLLARFRTNRFMPPTIREVRAEAGPELTAVLLDRGDFVKVSQDLYFLREAYDEMLAFIREYIEKHGPLPVAAVRDRFGMSRKYILPFLDHLDANKITVRIGDDRELVEKNNKGM